MEWRKINGRLTTELKFKDQTELANFIMKAAQHCDKVGHHADMAITYNCLTLSLYSHDAGRITDRDMKLAEKLEEFAAA